MHNRDAATNKYSQYSNRNSSSMSVAYTYATDSVRNPTNGVRAIWRSSRIIRCWAYQNIGVTQVCRV